MARLVTSHEELRSIIQEVDDRLIVIDFYADWCGPCVKLSPEIENLQNQFKDVIFIKVNVDCIQLGHDFDVTSIPHVMLFKKGQKVNEVLGFSPDKLKELIETYA